MRHVLLVSTYDLGRQPLGLASPAASLREAGVAVTCVDTSRTPLRDEDIARADLVAFYLAMHTATRLAAPLVARVRRVNPGARLAAYGLYAPLNGDWLHAQGVAHVIDRDAEAALVALARGADDTEPPAGGRAPLRRPDRGSLPPLAEYATLQLPDGTKRITGNTDATRGCKHLCRHCPIVPVYGGTFRAIPLDIVMEDVRAQVAAGARHMSFGDPDFFNGPTHARRLVERLHREHPGLTYDVTIKIEHLVRHAEMLPLLRDTGCVFVTSAVESIDDAVLERLAKGHTRADFVHAVDLCRRAGLTLVPTFVPFTPWTTIGGYLDLLAAIDDLDLVEHVAPIQLAIRLLITARSALLGLEDIQRVAGAFDGAALAYPWHHADPAVDALQADLMRIVAAGDTRPRTDVFDDIRQRACGAAGRDVPARRRVARARVPSMTESWYCCAEPLELQL